MALENKQKKNHTAYDPFNGNGANSKILTKKEPIKTLRFTSRTRRSKSVYSGFVPQVSVLNTLKT